MSEGSFFSRFRELDAASEPDALLAFLDRYATLEPVREHKRRATEALQLGPGQRVIDVGCGTGVDLLQMLEAVSPGGAVTGIDFSERAIALASEHLAGRDGIALEVADAQQLPFEDASFDACRTDRTLQHLERPERALAEIRRVLAPGGRFVSLDVVSGVEFPEALEMHPASAQVRALKASAADKQAWVPLMLPLLLARAGFQRTSIDVTELSTDTPEAVGIVLEPDNRAEEAVAAGSLSSDEAAEWLAAVAEAAAAGDVRVVIRGLRVTAVSP